MQLNLEPVSNDLLTLLTYFLSMNGKNKNKNNVKATNSFQGNEPLLFVKLDQDEIFLCQYAIN